MIGDNLRRVIVRDLETLLDEICAYPDEKDLWACPPGVANSTGTLALHMAGNLRHYIGAQLGGIAFVRDRDAEFADRGASREDLKQKIMGAIDAVDGTLRRLDDHTLEGEYPLEVGGVRLPTGLFLIHLATHLAFHLGQVDYHRRIVLGQAEGVGVQSLAKLA
jgi:hypothetical protein